MKEEQKYNGSKTRNYFTAYLLASIRGKRLRYLEKQQKILFAEENLEDKEYTDADISPEERLELEQKEQLLMEEAQGIYPEWNEMTDINLMEAMFSLQEEERKLIYQHVFEERMSRPRQHRHLKRKNSILFLVFLDFPHFFIHPG